MSIQSRPTTARPDDSTDRQWAAWMTAAQDGDRQAYERLLRAIIPLLRTVVRRAVREPADIDDALQDILVALHHARASYDPARPFRPWLIGIANHRLTDRLRRSGRILSRETPLDEKHETFSADPTNQDMMGLDTHALRTALASLPAGQRIAIEELKLREQSLQTVAERTGMSVGALKVATHRGLKRLRDLLRERTP